MRSKKEIRYNHGLHGDSRGFTDALVKVLDIEAAMEEYADALQKENDNLKKDIRLTEDDVRIILFHLIDYRDTLKYKPVMLTILIKELQKRII